LEGEIISSLEEISRLKKKNRLRKEQLLFYKEKLKEISEDIVILKIHLEEAKRREEIFMNQIKGKENIYDKLVEEIVSLKNDLKKSKTQMKFTKGYESLDNILSNQRSPDDIIGI
jgi:chromosome segregation ATPase